MALWLDVCAGLLLREFPLANGTLSRRLARFRGLFTQIANQLLPHIDLSHCGKSRIRRINRYEGSKKVASIVEVLAKESSTIHTTCNGDTIALSSRLLAAFPLTGMASRGCVERCAVRVMR